MRKLSWRFLQTVKIFSPAIAVKDLAMHNLNISDLCQLGCSRKQTLRIRNACEG